MDEIEAEKRVEKIYERADSLKRKTVGEHLVTLMKREHKSIKYNQANNKDNQ